MGSADSIEALPPCEAGEPSLALRRGSSVSYSEAFAAEPIVDPEEDDYDPRSPENLIEATAEEICRCEQQMLGDQIRRFEALLSSRPCTTSAGEIDHVSAHYHSLMELCKAEALQLSLRCGSPKGEGEGVVSSPPEAFRRRASTTTDGFRTRSTTAASSDRQTISFASGDGDTDEEKTPTNAELHRRCVRVGFAERRSNRAQRPALLDMSALKESLMLPGVSEAKSRLRRHDEFDMDAGSTTDDEEDWSSVRKRKTEDNLDMSPRLRKSPCSNRSSVSKRNSSTSRRGSRAALNRFESEVCMYSTMTM